MKQVDCIIIGSGAAGLSAALTLSRAGKKVIVIEQHYVPGGWCHSFYLKGQRFSPGVHYIGKMDKRASTSGIFEALGIANDLVFFRMNPAAYEHCWIGDKRIDMPAGINNLFNSLVLRFPEEQKGIKKYLALVRKVSEQLYLIPNMSGLWDNVTIPFRTAQLGKYGLFKLKTVINWFIKDPLLKQVLNIQCGDHGLPPGMAAFPVHCVAMDHYFDGGFYPMGGGAGIVKAMTTAIKKLGGEVRTGIGVKKILLQKNGTTTKATGILLENGEQINADIIISNADPYQTYHKLIGADNLSKKLNSKLSKTVYSVTSLMLFITVDMDVRKAGMDSGNIWMMRDKDMDELYKEMTGSDIIEDDEFPAVFISCSSLKDPVSFNGHYHNIEVVTYIRYQQFSRFVSEPPERSEQYLAYKEKIGEKLLNNLEKVLPHVRKHIVQMDVATPVTNEFYVRSTNGNVYGTEKNLMQVGPFTFGNKSEIEQLYLCGASILAHGVGGALNSGIQTAAKILNVPVDEIMKPEKDQNVRIYEAEDSSGWPEWLLLKMEQKKKLFEARAAAEADT